MANIRVFVRKSTMDPEFEPFELPDDQQAAVLAEAVREKFQMPPEQDGTPLVYYFVHKEGGNTVLRGTETLGAASVTTDNHLSLVSEPQSARPAR